MMHMFSVVCIPARVPMFIGHVLVLVVMAVVGLLVLEMVVVAMLVLVLQLVVVMIVVAVVILIAGTRTVITGFVVVVVVRVMYQGSSDTQQATGCYDCEAPEEHAAHSLRA